MIADRIIWFKINPIDLNLTLNIGLNHFIQLKIEVNTKTMIETNQAFLKTSSQTYSLSLKKWIN